MTLVFKPDVQHQTLIFFLIAEIDVAVVKEEGAAQLNLAVQLVPRLEYVSVSVRAAADKVRIGERTEDRVRF